MALDRKVNLPRFYRRPSASTRGESLDAAEGVSDTVIFRAGLQTGDIVLELDGKYFVAEGVNSR